MFTVTNATMFNKTLGPGQNCCINIGNIVRSKKDGTTVTDVVKDPKFGHKVSINATDTDKDNAITGYIRDLFGAAGSIMYTAPTTISPAYANGDTAFDFTVGPGTYSQIRSSSHDYLNAALSVLNLIG